MRRSTNYHPETGDCPPEGCAHAPARDDVDVRLASAFAHLRAAQTDLRKIGHHGLDIEPARRALRGVSRQIDEWRRTT